MVFPVKALVLKDVMFGRWGGGASKGGGLLGPREHRPSTRTYFKEKGLVFLLKGLVGLIFP